MPLNLEAKIVFSCKKLKMSKNSEIYNIFRTYTSDRKSCTRQLNIYPVFAKTKFRVFEKTNIFVSCRLMSLFALRTFIIKVFFMAKKEFLMLNASKIETKTRAIRQKKHPKSSVPGPVCLSADLRLMRV